MSFSSVYLIYKGICPRVPRACWKLMVPYLGIGAWLTFSQFMAVELLPVATVGSLYHAVWMIIIVFAAR